MRRNLATLSLVVVFVLGSVPVSATATGIQEDILEDEEVSESHVDVTDAVIKVEDGRTVIELEYDMSFSLSVYTVLFGSDNLEKALKKVIKADANVEFNSVSQNSATVIIDRELDGEQDFGQTIEYVEVFSDGSYEEYYDVQEIDLDGGEE